MIGGADPGQIPAVRPGTVPIPLYEVILPDDQGTRFIAAAPADRFDRRFRSGVLSVLKEFFKISPIVAVTGYHSDDINSFFMPLFMERLKSRLMPFIRAQYHETLAQELALQIIGAGATTLIVNWDPQMAQDANVPDILRYGLATNPEMRILIVGQDLNMSPGEWSKELEPFMTHFHGNRWYATPIIGIIPQIMNPVQAARYLFDNDEPEFLDAINYAQEYIPLLSSFLAFLRSTIGNDNPNPIQTLVEIIEDIPEAIGIRSSNGTAAVSVQGDRVISNFSAADLEKIKTVTGLVEPNEGYEIRTVTPNVQSRQESQEIIEARRAQQRILLRYRHPQVLRGSVLTNPAIINNYFARNPAAFTIRAIP